MADKEYIERGALIDKLKELKEEWGFTFIADGVEEAIFAVEEEPAADMVEVRHGEWEKVMNHRECNRCRYKAPYKKIKAGYHLLDLSRFCPNCGAKMDGERKDIP